MDRLRPREREVFSGFTDNENLYMCSRSANSTGKPVVKWDKVQSWFHNRLMNPDKTKPLSKGKHFSSQGVSKNLTALRDASQPNKANDTNHLHKEGEKLPDLSELEFEARSRDKAWYDVDRFITHRFLTSGEAEVLVRFVGFGAEEDEWINVKNDVRERSIPLDNWECHKVNPEDVMLCLQERKDQAIYYDAHILDVQRKMHDIRGCRCIFLVRYDHDKSEEKVRLRRLCRRA